MPKRTLKRIAKAPAIDNLTRSDREEAITQWLDAHGVPYAWDVAPAFVTAGLDSVWLEDVAKKLPAEGQADAISWLETRLNLKLLAAQVEQSTGRIVELVKAIKS